MWDILFFRFFALILNLFFLGIVAHKLCEEIAGDVRFFHYSAVMEYRNENVPST